MAESMSTRTLDKATLMYINAQLSSSELVDTLAYLEPQAALASQTNSVSPSSDELRLAVTFYASFAIALLLDDELPEAGALLRRLPESVASSTGNPSGPMRPAEDLVKASRDKNHSSVYQAIEAFESKYWAEVLEPLVRRFHKFFVQRTLEFIQTAFDTIPRPLAMQYLNIKDTQSEMTDDSRTMTGEAERLGWRFDESKDVLYPRSAAVKTGPTVSTGGSVEKVAKLVELVGQLSGQS